MNKIKEVAGGCEFLKSRLPATSGLRAKWTLLNLSKGRRLTQRYRRQTLAKRDLNTLRHHTMKSGIKSGDAASQPETRQLRMLCAAKREDGTGDGCEN